MAFISPVLDARAQAIRGRKKKESSRKQNGKINRTSKANLLVASYDEIEEAIWGLSHVEFVLFRWETFNCVVCKLNSKLQL